MHATLNAYPHRSASRATSNCESTDSRGGDVQPRARRPPAASLTGLVESAIERTAAQACSRRVDIDLHEPGLVVAADPGALSAALASVLNNACRFSLPSSRVRVISRLAWADGAQHLVLAVCDRGIGMRRAHQQRAFDPGWQAHHAPGDTGRGMGLTQARQMVEAQGGWMELRSALGIGTEVEIWLPAMLSAGRPA